MKQKIIMVATCYESEVRYPTDMKLLSESVEWCNSMDDKGIKAT